MQTRNNSTGPGISDTTLPAGSGARTSISGPGAPGRIPESGSGTHSSIRDWAHTAAATPPSAAAAAGRSRQGFSPEFPPDPRPRAQPLRYPVLMYPAERAPPGAGHPGHVPAASHSGPQQYPHRCASHEARPGALARQGSRSGQNHARKILPACRAAPGVCTTGKNLPGGFPFRPDFCLNQFRDRRRSTAPQHPARSL